jgi:hypothetical protein
MKKFLFLLCLATGIIAFAQDPADIAFKTTSHQFGKIKQNIPATYVFTFTNNTAKPAVIEFANAECGCTTPEYDKAPIPKGKSSTIKVTYNAANPGAFKKNVNIKFVNIQLPYVLTIEGEVVVAPAKAKAKTK